MEMDDFMKLGVVSLQTAMMISAPILVLGLVAGLAVSIFQAATQISDSAIAFIPKIGATFLGIAVFGHFMLSRMASFTIWVYQHIPSLSQ